MKHLIGKKLQEARAILNFYIELLYSFLTGPENDCHRQDALEIWKQSICHQHPAHSFCKCFASVVTGSAAPCR